MTIGILLRLRLFASAGALLTVALCPLGVQAEPGADRPVADRASSPAIGFSNLVVRIDGDDEIGIAKEDFRVRIIEAMRSHGLNAVGMESLVFGKDRSEAADLMLGGTIRELVCLARGSEHKCRIGIEWQVLDVAEDTVVYKAMTRSAVAEWTSDEAGKLGNALVLGALEALMRRERFKELLRPDAATSPSAPKLESARFRRCEAEPRPLPESAEAVMSATVVIRSGARLGSGFFISPDGLVLTAAHVLGRTPTVRLRDGSEHQAGIVRVNRELDVALLRVKSEDVSCLPLAQRPASVGTDAYVIGAPAGEEFAFSLTRGVVSGWRTLRGHEYLQTDASINPGNSGGPLLNASGEAMALASFKLAGRAVEGIAFGIPVDAALRALALVPGERTSAVLRRVTVAPANAAGSPGLFEDTSDEVPVLDAAAEERERRQAEATEQRRTRKERRRQRREATPATVKTLRWGSIALGAAGAALAGSSSLRYQSGEMTRPEYERLRKTNDVGWILLGTGVAGFVTSVALTPRRAASGDEQEAARASLRVAGDGAWLDLTWRY